MAFINSTKFYHLHLFTWIVRTLLTVLLTLSCLQLCVNLHLPKQRDRRGGRRKQHAIETIVGHRPPRKHFNTQSPSNLTFVNIDDNNNSNNNDPRLLNFCPYSPQPPSGDTLHSNNSLNVNSGQLCNDKARTPKQSMEERNSTPTNNTLLKILYFNSRSCRNKTLQINDFIAETKADIIFITETWLREEGDEPLVTEMLPKGYNLHGEPRKLRTGGGVAIIYRDSLQIVKCPENLQYATFEHCKMTVKTPHCAIFCVCIYHPSPSKKNRHTLTEFQQDLSDFLDSINNKNNVYILGDLNYHYENSTNSAVKNLRTLIDEHNFQQLVTNATHEKQHTLDLVMTRSELSVESDVEVTDFCISDHYAISFKINIEKPKTKREKMLYRNIKDISIENFKDDLKQSFSDKSPKSVDELNRCLREILNQHAPLRDKLVPIRTTAPWLNERVMDAKKKKRKAERQWKKTGLTVHKDIYRQQIKSTANVIKEEKAKYLNEQITNSESSSNLYSICNELLGKKKVQDLPTNIPLSELPEVFNRYFIEKIKKIRENLDTTNSDPGFDKFEGNSFSSYKPVTEDFVKSIIMKSPKKFCELDPLPVNLFLSCLDVILPHITNVINQSLDSGVVVPSFKEAIVRPLLKKSNLNQNELKNYRPVSNLPFLSKILEKVVLSQIDEHLNENNLKGNYQSAYKRKHSTETALVKVQSDLLNAIDEGKISVLALLDLSAAFDTLDHDILLKRLELSFGIKGTALEWFSSYISNRKQSVSVGGKQSEPSVLHFGVPQGSVLGPILFSLYAQPVHSIINHYHFNNHIYADDTQLYKSVEMLQLPSVITSLDKCVTKVSSWMTSNKLKLNESKTEVMVIGTKTKVEAANIKSVKICGEEISVVEKVRNLGVIFDSNLSMEGHISHLRKLCYMELKRISHIRKYINLEATNKLVCSFILSRLDYCNSLQAGLPLTQINKLQQIQNNAARLVMKLSKREHITPILKHLHWLPVKSRINYKIATISYQCLHEVDFPVYLQQLVSRYTPNRPLRSLNKNTIRKPKTHLKTFGQRALQSQAAEIWNILPQDVRLAESLNTFKSRLKTHYFCESF